MRLLRKHSCLLSLAFLPRHPLCFAAFKHLVEHSCVFISVHALPKSIVLVSHKLIVFCESFHWPSFKHTILVKIIKYLPVENEKTTINPHVHERLFIEASYHVTFVNFYDSEI